MAARKSTKREFDWRAYTKPARLLSPSQEEALASGVLRPVLDYALADETVSFEIRARQATLYYRGASLVRLRGSEQPFSADIDANLRLPKGERGGAEHLESWPLTTTDEVAACLRELDALRTLLDRWSAEDGSPSAREHLTRFSAANAGATAASDELVVVDIEYQYGRRRFDFVGMRRAAAVGGSGAFTTPRLVIGELRYPGRSLTGNSSMAGFASDAAEFTHALSGEHLARAKAELADLIAQKQRLGLLPAEIPFVHFTADQPELLVVFTDPAFATPAFDAPIAELHDKLIARHFPADLLRLTAVGEASAEHGGDGTLLVRDDDVMVYRAFKGFRKRLQG